METMNPAVERVFSDENENCKIHPLVVVKNMAFVYKLTKSLPQTSPLERKPRETNEGAEECFSALHYLFKGFPT